MCMIQFLMTRAQIIEPLVTYEDTHPAGELQETVEAPVSFGGGGDGI